MALLEVARNEAIIVKAPEGTEDYEETIDNEIEIIDEKKYYKTSEGSSSNSENFFGFKNSMF